MHDRHDTLEAHDIEQDLRALMPYLFSTDAPADTVYRADHRKHVAETLRAKYGEQAMPEISSLINRLIEKGNEEARLRMHLFPEPMVHHETRVARIAPHMEAVAYRIDEARGHILESILAAVEADQVPRERYPALLLLALTLDDRLTGGALLRSLLYDARPIKICDRPFLMRHVEHSVHAECIPIGYCSARVIAAATRNGASIRPPRKQLPPVYARACTHMRRHHIDVEMPKSITEYLSALRHTHAISGIPALVHSRDRDAKNSALPIRAAYRLITGLVPDRMGEALGQVNHSERDGGGDRAPAAPSKWVGPGDTATNWPRVSAIMQQPGISSRSRGEYVAALAREISAEQAHYRPYSLAWLLMDWLAAMLYEGRLHVDTVRQRVGETAALLEPHDNALGHYFEDAVAWRLFYGKVAAEDVEHRQSAWQAVRAFHCQLVTAHHAAPMEWDRERLDEAQRRTDNNLLTPADYERARRLLAPYTGSRVVDIADCMLIVGYRLGLRFSEARTLEIRQLEDAADPWVHVRPNRWLPKLKSESRRIPMDPMLPAEERTKLIAWRRQRMQESGGDASAALFSGGPEEPEPIGERRLRPLLAETLSNATGDDCARYHHLRHSAATWMFVRFLRPEIDDRAWAGIAAFDHDDLSLARCREFRDRVLMGASGQEAMWVVSQILGHVSPAVTRRSYLRAIEWLSLAETWSCREMDASVLRRLLGLGRSRAFELHQCWGQRYGPRATRDWAVTTDWTPQPAPEETVKLSQGEYGHTALYAEMKRRCNCANAVADLPEDHRDEVTVLAAQWDFPAEVIDRHLRAIAEVHRRFRTRMGFPRFGTRVKLPRSHTEQKDLEKWIAHLWAAWTATTNRPGNKMRIGRILAITATSLARERSAVRFHRPRYARRYLDDLEAVLGIDRSRNLAFLRQVAGETREEFDHRRRRVAHSLNLATDQVTMRSGQQPAASDSGGVEISVQAPQSGSARGPHQARRGSEAFRALVHYALVRVHELRSPHSIQPQ